MPDDWSQFPAASSASGGWDAFPKATPSPKAASQPPTPDEIQTFRNQYFNTNNPLANRPTMAAFALAQNPNDPVWGPRVAQMQPVSQVAIRQRAQEIAQERANPRVMQGAPLYQGIAGFIPNAGLAAQVSPQTKINQQPATLPTNIIPAAVAAGYPETQRKIDKGKGGYAAAQLAESLVEPTNVIVAQALAPAFMSKLGATALGTAFAVPVAREAGKSFGEGDIVGGTIRALAAAGMGVIPQALHKSAPKQNATVTRLKAQAVPEVLQPPTEPKPSGAAPDQPATPTMTREEFIRNGPTEGKVRSLPSGSYEILPDDYTPKPATVQATAPEARPAKPVKGEKYNKGTGLTASQEQYLGSALRDANQDMIDSGKDKTVSIKVPGDGTFTVHAPEQAARLHKAVTGEDIPMFKGMFTDARKATPLESRLPSYARQGSLPKLSEEERAQLQPIKTEATGNLTPVEQVALNAAKRNPSSGTLQSGIGPTGTTGEPPLISEESIANSGPGRVAASVKLALSPASMTEEAGATARAGRGMMGEFARRQEVAAEKWKGYKKAFNQLSPDERVQWIKNYQDGKLAGDPVHDSIETEFADRAKQAQDLGFLKELRENYFPNMWEDRTKAANFYARRPLEGGKSFTKQRIYEDIQAGIDAGLKPLTTNPIEMAELKIREMDRAILGRQWLQYMKDEKIAQFVRTLESRPDGYVKLNDPSAEARELRPTEKADGTSGAPEVILRGNWYAPEAAARVFNNHLSPGLRGMTAYDAIRASGNALNMAQLGLSGFHATFTGLDSIVSKGALGLRQMAHGSPMQKVSGAINTVRSAVPGLNATIPIETLVKGYKLRKSYRSGATGALESALAEAGGRTRMDPYYKMGAVNSFQNALQSWKEAPNLKGKMGASAKSLLTAPWAALETAAKPLMEQAVPLMKLGVFSDLARFEMERLGPDVSPAARSKALTSAWDSVDNRMGQLVYDNLFWNRTVKDIGMVMTRSLGWNLGSVREIGGGLVDVNPYAVAKRVKATGGKDLVTNRMAYDLALPAVVAGYGAIMTYLYTGRGPKEMRDYFQPPDGHGGRVQLPTYTRDLMRIYQGAHRGGVSGAVSAGTEMAKGKEHPLIQAVIEQMENNDFFDKPIRNEHDPLVKQTAQTALHVAKQFTPYSLGAGKKPARTPGEAVQRFFGIMPTPSDKVFKTIRVPAK